MQAHKAGPGPDPGRRKGQEAAGPAGPRLIMGEVSFHLDPRGTEAQVSLLLGARRFTGKSASRGQAHWQLAAAATVEATQHYLQQCLTAAPAPHVRLLATALDSTRFGQEIVHVTVSFTDGDRTSCLLGSALVRNDRCSTAVAAALDAISRRLARYRLSPAPPAPEPAIFREEEPEPRPPFPESPAAEQAGPDLTPSTPHVSPRPAAYGLGLGIGLTSVSAAAVDPEGRPAAQVHRAVRPADPAAALRLLLEVAHEAVAQLNSHATRLGAVGVAAPGTLRPREGICESCRDLPLWKEVQLVQPVSEELALPVELVGATRAAALAETRFGAARGLSDVVFVRVGAGLEVAAVAEGGLRAPALAGGAGLGHLVLAPDGPPCACGAAGCWSALAGQEALVNRVLRSLEEGAKTTLGTTSGGAITAAAVCRAAAIGDQVARTALEETTRYLALGLGNVIAMFDPEAVILDSAPSAVGAVLRRALENALKASPRAAAFSRCVLLSPDLGDSAPALGAAAWALEAAARGQG